MKKLTPAMRRQIRMEREKRSNRYSLSGRVKERAGDTAVPVTKVKLKCLEERDQTS